VIGEIPKLPNLHRTALMQVFLKSLRPLSFCAMSSPLQIWHPFSNSVLDPPPIRVAIAEGALLHTADGRQIIDAISSCG